VQDDGLVVGYSMMFDHHATFCIVERQERKVMFRVLEWIEMGANVTSCQLLRDIRLEELKRTT
jgi:hypothetical protein